jgi:hypothetical protein
MQISILSIVNIIQQWRIPRMTYVCVCDVYVIKKIFNFHWLNSTVINYYYYIIHYINNNNMMKLLSSRHIWRLTKLSLFCHELNRIFYLLQTRRSFLLLYVISIEFSLRLGNASIPGLQRSHSFKCFGDLNGCIDLVCMESVRSTERMLWLQTAGISLTTRSGSCHWQNISLITNNRLSVQM